MKTQKDYDELIEELTEMVHLDDGDSWDDPYSLLEAIQLRLEIFNVQV